MARTTFSGPIRTGKEYGNPTSDTIGTVVLCQTATVAVGAMKDFIVLPPNCSLINSIAVVRQAVSGIAAGVSIRVGTSADSTKYATLPVSAARSYDITAVSGANIPSIGTADSNLIVIDATAQASAAELTQFDAVVYLTYIQNS